MNKRAFFAVIGFLFALLSFTFRKEVIEGWQSKWIKINSDNTISYTPDSQGNIIPDFSNIGYFGGDVAIPNVGVVKTISAASSGSSERIIQDAINEVAKRTPDANGFRGAILLKKGTYSVSGILKINTSGIVLRGEGSEKSATKIVAAGNVKRSLIEVSGTGNLKEDKASRVKIKDDYLPVGAKSFTVETAKNFKVGDPIIVYRPGTENWISDLKMNQIVEKKGTTQWSPSGYNFSFERKITKIDGNKIFIDNPIVMAMETKYGGGEIFKYSFDGRIEKVGIENLCLESEFESDTAENHGWDAISYQKVQQSWVRNVAAYYFGYSCVNLSPQSKNITVLDSYCFEGKSILTGGRRYSFNNNGQLNLFINCHTTEGRHDFVTGAKVCGPNAFVNCTAKNTHGDTGPHHRWAMGTLYDNIVTDGEINVRDRGNSGSGHGWAGVNQVLWNCKVKTAVVQNPWVTGRNWVIGLQGKKVDNSFKLGERPDGEWEGNNKAGLQPTSLYATQLKAKANH
jgi:hypothetical protein